MNWKTLAAFALGFGLIWGAGCGNRPEPTKPEEKKDKDKKDKDKKDEDKDDHEHGAGPHGGVIIELDKYHGEFKPDHAKKEATVWILKGDAKTAARVKADKVRLVVTNTDPKIEIDLLPVDKSDDGTASTFSGKHDGFGTPKEYKGTVSVTVDKKSYSGDFEEKTEPKK